MKQDITELFICIDDFLKIYEKNIQAYSLETPETSKRKTRTPGLSLAELMTIVLLFQRSPCKNFKYFYQSYLQLYLKDFPKLCSYNLFVELMKTTLLPMTCLLNFLMGQADKTGYYYIDSTIMPVCHNKRTSHHRVFEHYAKLSKSSMGWFFGLKLHLVMNYKGELIAAKLTPGNVDDRAPVPELVKNLQGLIFGDKGYIDTKLFHRLYEQGIKLVTGLKKNMKGALMPLEEKIFLKKRSVIESVNGLLKETFQLVHTRHRSVWNAFVHISSTLIAYILRSKKPSINFS
jgi:hypothetical protein